MTRKMVGSSSEYVTENWRTGITADDFDIHNTATSFSATGTENGAKERRYQDNYGDSPRTTNRQEAIYYRPLFLQQIPSIRTIQTIRTPLASRRRVSLRLAHSHGKVNLGLGTYYIIS